MENMNISDKFLKNEVIYWLNALQEANGNDEIGKKAIEILENENKIQEIIEKLHDDEEIWETMHNCIEYYMHH